MKELYDLAETLDGVDYYELSASDRRRVVAAYIKCMGYRVVDCVMDAINDGPHTSRLATVVMATMSGGQNDAQIFAAGVMAIESAVDSVERMFGEQAENEYTIAANSLRAKKRGW